MSPKILKRRQGAALHGQKLAIYEDKQMNIKNGLFFVVLSGIILASGQVCAGDDDGFKPLFNGKNLQGWKVFLKDDKADPAKTITVKDGEIQVTGEPYGYFYTDNAFKNFIIRYSWTYPKNQPEKTTMNSGLLLHIQEPHKVWPKSVEPQGRYMDHGKLFFIGFDKGSKREDIFDAKAQKEALKPSHEWNATEATVRGDGTIEVRINGKLVSYGRSELTSGLIGFQSEGARIHFKDIKIKMLD
ncbi:MAG: DUF1080 domain-containing protein [Planctomycetes bacterium]|nr:DUF1080 domain-containing protein [Planctomycetota bacterium]